MLQYVINVAMFGQHYFATDPASLNDVRAAIVVFREIYRRFPKEEGFEVTVSSRTLPSGQILTDTFLREMRLL